MVLDGLHFANGITITTRLFSGCYVANLRCYGVLDRLRVSKNTPVIMLFLLKGSVEETCKTGLTKHGARNELFVQAFFIEWRLSLVIQALLRKKTRPDGTDSDAFEHCWFTHRFVWGAEKITKRRRPVGIWTAKDFACCVYWQKSGKIPLKKWWFAEQVWDMNFDRPIRTSSKWQVNDWEPLIYSPYTESNLRFPWYWANVLETRS